MAADPLRTRLCDEYGCEYPIVGFAHTKDVVAAVTNAGGIGVYGANSLTAEQMRSDLRWIRERVGDRPFGVDLLLSASYVEGSPEELESQIPQEHADFVEQVMAEHGIPEPKTPGPWGVARVDLLRKARAKFEIIKEERIPIFASGMGSPAFILDELHAAGVKVWGLVGLARQAKRELEQGLDLIVAQGQDSGGHTGRMGTFSLVREVTELARSHDTPILAAGGVVTGEHLVAALALGADGAWCGTIWQTTHESETSMAKKQKLIAAGNQDAWVSTAIDGKRRRVVRNRMLEVFDAPDAPAPARPASRRRAGRGACRRPAPARPRRRRCRGPARAPRSCRPAPARAPRPRWRSAARPRRRAGRRSRFASFVPSSCPFANGGSASDGIEDRGRT